MKKVLLPAILILLLLGLWLTREKWLPANAAGVNAELTLYGNVEIRDARLVFNEAEIIREMLVEEGDKVEKGQVLACLRTQIINDQLAAARAVFMAQKEILRRLQNGTRPQEIEEAKSAVATARARADNLRLTAERLCQTAASGASSRQVLDDAEAGLAVAVAELEGRRQALALALAGPRNEEIAEAAARLQSQAAAVKMLEHRLEDTILRAPAAGIIQSRILEPGEMAGPTRPVYVLALTDPKWVRAYISEPDLGRLDQGAKAWVSSDSWPKRHFSGQAGFISPIAEFTPQNVETTDLRSKLVYEVRILVDDPDNCLKLGMPVTVGLSAPPATNPNPKSDSQRD